MTYLFRLVPPPVLGTLMLTLTILLCPVLVAMVVLASLLRDSPGFPWMKRARRDAALRAGQSEAQYETLQQNHLIRI